MGRPLFSSAPPAVRVEPEPEPQSPALQRWSHWNAFDPDSAEFFERDDAVYEAFISPDAVVAINSLTPGAILSSSVLSDAELSSSSDTSSSGRGTPMQADDGHDEDSEEPPLRPRSRLITPPLVDVDAFGPGLLSATRDSRYLSSITAATRSPGAPTAPREFPVERPIILEREVTYIDFPGDQEHGREDDEDERELARTPSPVHNLRTQPWVIMPRTPPRQIVSSVSPSAASPSPPPSVTPRLYSWRTLAGSVPASPLTNRGARTSVAHIATPTLVPIQRAS